MNIEKINWVDNKMRQSVTSDVSVSIVGRKKSSIGVIFPAGIMATKFRHADRILLGFNDEDKCVCFTPGDARRGYKVTTLPNKSGRIYISADRCAGHCEPHQIQGNYKLKSEGNVHYFEYGRIE